MARSPTAEMRREASARSTQALMRGRASWKSASCATPSTTRHTLGGLRFSNMSTSYGPTTVSTASNPSAAPAMPQSVRRESRSTPPSARWKPSCCTSSHTSRRFTNPMPSMPVESRTTSTATTPASSASGVSTRARSWARSMIGHERRDREVHAEEPQRLADAESRRRDELGGKPGERQRDERAATTTTSAIAGRTSRSSRDRT